MAPFQPAGLAPPRPPPPTTPRPQQTLVRVAAGAGVYPSSGFEEIRSFYSKASEGAPAGAMRGITAAPKGDEGNPKKKKPTAAEKRVQAMEAEVERRVSEKLDQIMGNRYSPAGDAALYSERLAVTTRRGADEEEQPTVASLRAASTTGMTRKKMNTDDAPVPRGIRRRSGAPEDEAGSDSDMSAERDHALSKLAAKQQATVRQSARVDAKGSGQLPTKGESGNNKTSWASMEYDEPDQRSGGSDRSSLGLTSGVTSEESMSVATASVASNAPELKEQESSAFGWGELLAHLKPASQVPEAWEEPATGVTAERPWGAPMLRKSAVEQWGPQMSAAAQSGFILTWRSALDQAETGEGFMFPGPALMLYTYKLPAGGGRGDNQSGKQLQSTKTAAAVGYISQELYTSMSAVNESVDAGVKKYSQTFPAVEFAGDMERLQQIMSLFASGAEGANIFDDPNEVRDARLGLLPERLKRGQVVRQFGALVKQHCFDCYLNPAQAGPDADRFCLTRHMQVTLFVLHRYMKVFATRNLDALTRDFYKDWNVCIQGDEKARGPTEMTSMLQGSMRLMGISCPTCNMLGGWNRFCKDIKCPSNLARNSSNKTPASAPTPGTKEHFQEAKSAAARAELNIGSSAVVPWGSLSAEWQKKFQSGYVTKHNLAASWTATSAKSAASSQRATATAGPAAYWDNQSAIKGLDKMLLQFEGSSALSLGGARST